MGTQRPVKIGEELPEDLGGPIAEHHGKKKPARRSLGAGGEKEKKKKTEVEEKIKEKKFEKPEEKIEEVGETVKKAEKPEVEEKIKKVKVGKAKIRSKRYRELSKLLDHNKIYTLGEAIELIKKTTLTKFDGNVEAHIRVLSKGGQNPENLRGTLNYPHATGRKVKVVILDEKLIEEILKTNKTDFDVALATPKMMPRVAKLAKILGPKGKMPNPKSGTITDDPEKTKKKLEEGMTEYKTDSYGIIHQVVGKVSAEPKVLEENIKALLAVLPADKIVSFHLSATMGPSVKVLTR